jgi:Fis family transcriptional regulator, factor for inversion stimulation protein
MKAELEALIEQMIARGILFDEAVQAFEKQFILNIVSRHQHNLSKAAEALGIHRNTLSKRLAEYQNSNGQVRRENIQRRKTNSKPAARSAAK